MTEVDRLVSQHRRRMLTELKALLRIPSVSTDPAHDSDCREAALWLADHLRALGCPSVELLGSHTHPVVHAKGPEIGDGPTILVYGHYDVQPPDPIEKWESPPFEPTERGGDLVARGATDDKGQLFAIIKAFEITSLVGDPPVNVRFLLEGQEESGGEVLLELTTKQPELFHADVVVVADGPYYAPGWPCVVVGTRGICYAEITLRTLKEDLHSGLYGGVAPNALEELTRLLAALKTPTGRIRIPGIYDSVRRPNRAERESWECLPFCESRFLREEVQASTLVGDSRCSVHERLWALPTLDIHGITGGYEGDGVMTVIPAEARATVSLRLVPDQRPHVVFRQLTDALTEAAPSHAEVDVQLLTEAEPVLVDVAHPAFDRLSVAFHVVEGRGLALTRSGGSLPIVSALSKSGAVVLLAGIGLPDDRLHAPNEKICIEQFTNGIRVFARFFQSMASCGKGETE